MNWNEEGDLVVPICENLWAVFFTSNLVRRIIGQHVGFAINFQEENTQVILLYPLRGAHRLPTVERLFHSFPIGFKGQPYGDPDHIPVSPKSWLDISHLIVRTRQVGKRKMVLLIPTWQKADRVSAKRFVSLYLENPGWNVAGEVRQALTGEEFFVVSYREKSKELNLIALADNARIDVRSDMMRVGLRLVRMPEKEKVG